MFASPLHLLLVLADKVGEVAMVVGKQAGEATATPVVLSQITTDIPGKVNSGDARYLMH